MHVATLDKPKFVSWERYLADAEKDEPPIENRLAVRISDDAACSFVDFLDEHFYCDPEHLGWDLHRQLGGPDGLGQDLFATAVAMHGVPDRDAYCERLWKSFGRERIGTDRLLIDGMDEAIHYGWNAPPDIAAAIESLREMRSQRSAERKAAEKAHDDAHSARLDRYWTLDDAGYGDWLDAGRPEGRALKFARWKARDAAEYEELARYDALRGRRSAVAPLPLGTPMPTVAQPTSPLPLTFFDECRNRAPKHWIFKGVFAKGENSSIFGAPGTLKSAFLADAAVHAAAGKDWRGFKNKEKCGVIYFAFERADQVRRRLAAYATRDGLKDLPIAVAGNIVDMLNPECVDIVVATIRAAEASFDIPVGFIVFDTWSKGIAAGGGDEDKARDQNIIAANLRRIHEQVSVHIAGVGHSGKDETRGERGSNARQGDVDLQIQISGDAVKTATVIKANDQPEGPLTSYAGEIVALGADEDGDPITAFIVSARSFLPVAKTAKRNPRHDMAMGALHKAVQTHGQDIPAPPGLSGHAVAIDRWRDELFGCGFLEHDAANPRADFKRIKQALIDSKRITIRNEFVWPTSVPPSPPGQ